jgi:hypothetical protein
MKTTKLKLDELMTRVLEALDIGYGEDLLEDIQTFREEWGLRGKTVAEVAEELGLDEMEVLRWCEEVWDARSEHSGEMELALRVSGPLVQGLLALLRESVFGLGGGE